jgi:hypothetical protein
MQKDNAAMQDKMANLTTRQMKPRGISSTQNLSSGTARNQITPQMPIAEAERRQAHPVMLSDLAGEVLPVLGYERISASKQKVMQKSRTKARR